MQRLTEQELASIEAARQRYGRSYHGMMRARAAGDDEAARWLEKDYTRAIIIAQRSVLHRTSCGRSS